MTTNNTPATMTSFPFLDVMNDIARRCKYLPASSREETASAALLAAHGRWERQQTKPWSISMLSAGGMLDVAKLTSRSRRHAQPDSETVELLAVSHDSSSSDGLDDLLSGLTGRDRVIAIAWSNGHPDTVAADLAGCSVRTVVTVRQQLRDRLSRKLQTA